MELLPENQDLLEIWQQVKLFGADFTFKLRDIIIATTQAEELLANLTFIESVVAELQEQESNKE